METRLIGGRQIEEERCLDEKEQIRLIENTKAGEKLGKEVVGMSNKNEVHNTRKTYKYRGEGHSLKAEVFQSLRLSLRQQELE